MREILFRGKRKDNGEWVGGYFVINHLSLDTYFIVDTESIMHQIIPETVGQYTGLTDKNGKMIFEGDIVLYLPDNENMIIEYWADLAMFQVVGDVLTTDFDHIRGYDVEVVGNVFDNPEFLKEMQRNECYF